MVHLGQGRTALPVVGPPAQEATAIEAAGLQFICGEIYTGSTLASVRLSHGTIQSVEGFEPKLDFKDTNGLDWLRNDADKTHGRLSISAIAADAEGRCIRVMADGMVELNQPILALITGHPERKTIPSGHGGEMKLFNSMLFVVASI
ncbi:hypothetical protein BDW68DRAFT_175802 [Aspergillus falconensis]